MERVMQRKHYSMARHVHHARGHHGSYDNTERGDYHHLAESSNLGTNGRLKEVDSVVANTDEEVEYCKT